MARNNSFNLEINPKVVNYPTNGTGRDTYIKFNNGGFKLLAAPDSTGPKIISKTRIKLSKAIESRSY